MTGCPLPNASATALPGELERAGRVGSLYLYLVRLVAAGDVVSYTGFVSGSFDSRGSVSVQCDDSRRQRSDLYAACSLNVTPSVLHMMTTCPLPDAQLGQNYSAQVTGGVVPYQFAFATFPRVCGGGQQRYAFRVFPAHWA